MKEIYSVIINRKWEITKYVLFVFLFSLYYPIYNFLSDVLIRKVGESNILYVDRLLFIVLIGILLVYTRAKFLKFVKKNWDSLILLGCSYSRCFSLFFLTNYDVLILMVYLGTMFFQIQELSIGSAIQVNILHAVLIYMLAILSCLIFHNPKRDYSIGVLVCVLVGVLGIMIGTKKISFQTVYAVVMSDCVTQLLFSDSLLFLVIKLSLVILLLSILIYKCMNTGIDITITEKRSGKMNLFGDLLHWLSKSPLYVKNYFWMYRSKDFILWKIFSTALFIIICYTTTSNSVLFITAYGICIISSLYFIDTYNLERTLLLHYFMSDYPYKMIFADVTKGGVLILGDNVLVILLIRSCSQPGSVNVFLLLIAAILFITVFVNSNLLAKYPLRQFYINMCLILIKLHLPIFNLYFLYKDIRNGKSNWESMSYEHKR